LGFLKLIIAISSLHMTKQLYQGLSDTCDNFWLDPHPSDVSSSPSFPRNPINPRILLSVAEKPAVQWTLFESLTCSDITIKLTVRNCCIDSVNISIEFAQNLYLLVVEASDEQQSNVFHRHTSWLPSNINIPLGASFHNAQEVIVNFPLIAGILR
jgi:hypothetical protein